MLVTELCNNLCSGRGLIPQYSPTSCCRTKTVEDLFGEPLGIQGKRFVGHDPRDFPMSGRAVLPGRLLGHTAEATLNGRPGIESGHPSHTTKPEAFKIGQGQPADRARNVRQRIRSLITVCRSVGKFANADTIKNNEYELAASQSLWYKGIRGKEMKRYA